MDLDLRLNDLCINHFYLLFLKTKIISFRSFPTYNLSKFVLPIIQPQKKQLVLKLRLDKYDRFISFDVENLYTNVPKHESLQIIVNTLNKDEQQEERSNLPALAIIDLLKCCLQTTYFQKGNQFYEQQGLLMGSPLSSIAAKIYMKFFEQTAITSAKKQTKNLAEI